MMLLFGNVIFSTTARRMLVCYAPLLVDLDHVFEYGSMSIFDVGCLREHLCIWFPSLGRTIGDKAFISLTRSLRSSIFIGCFLWIQTRQSLTRHPIPRVSMFSSP